MFQLNKKHQKYEKYNPTNIDWIGDIPNGWEVWKLKRLGNIETGTTPPKAEEGNYMEDGIPWIKPDNLDGFVPLNDSKEKLSQMGALQARIIKKGSVLVCGIGTIGKIGVAGCDLTTNQQINSITFNQKIDELFGQYLVFASRKEMEKQSNKVVVSILNKSQQSNIFYPVCSLQEQQKIATYLNEKTAILDEAIVKKKNQIELLAEHRTALINDAITKGLDKNVDMIDSGIEWIGMIPKGWEIRRIKTFSQVRRGASPRPIDDPIYFDENGEYSWVRIADVSASDRYLTEASQRLSALGQSLSVEIEPGELFVSIAGTVGKPIISGIKCCIHDGFVYFNNLVYNKELLYWIFIGGEAYKGLGKLGTQLNLNTETIGNIAVPYPSLKEQQVIVDYIDKETKYIDDMIAKIEKSIELLEEYKTSLISHAVSGKIRVS